MFITRKQKIRENNEAIKLSLPIPKILEDKMFSEYLAFCPFHDSEKPHLAITKDYKACHCLSCGFHGTSINLLYEMNGIKTPEQLYQHVKFVYDINMPYKNLASEAIGSESFLSEINERMKVKTVKATIPPNNPIGILHKAVRDYKMGFIDEHLLLNNFANVQRETDVEYIEKDSTVNLDDLMGGEIDWT